jgi:hypothetical protein
MPPLVPPLLEPPEPTLVVPPAPVLLEPPAPVLHFGMLWLHASNAVQSVIEAHDCAFATMSLTFEHVAPAAVCAPAVHS